MGAFFDAILDKFKGWIITPLALLASWLVGFKQASDSAKIKEANDAAENYKGQAQNMADRPRTDDDFHSRMQQHIKDAD